MRLACVLLPAALLAACASPYAVPDLAPGTDRAAVVARAGAPHRVLELPGGGQRLQYTTQPFGHAAFMVDLDAAGRVVRARQVLEPAAFARIEPGRWTCADVEREFGPPALVEAVASWPGLILTYRWKDGNEPMFYWVYLDREDVVRRAHPGIEHINAPNDRN